MSPARYEDAAPGKPGTVSFSSSVNSLYLQQVICLYNPASGTVQSSLWNPFFRVFNGLKLVKFARSFW